MRCGDLARNVAPSGNRRSPAMDPSTTDKPVAIRMANDPRYRSSRPDRLSQDRPSGDPLSELARLIGQDDAVAATARNGASRRHRDGTDREEISPVPPRRGGPSPEEVHEESRAASDRHSRYDDSDARQGAYLPQPPAPGLQEGDAYDPRAGNGASYHGYEEDAGFRRGSDADDRVPYADGEAEAYDAPAYDDRYDEDPDAAGYDNGPYYGQDGRMAEDLYEGPPPRRRSRLYPLAVVLGVAVVGTAAAYAYRTWTNAGSDTPPVIKASTEPTKLMPTGNDGQSGKQIYDRLDRGPGQNEQVVSREEEPVNLQGRSMPGDGLATPGTAATGSLGGVPSGGPVASPPMLSGGTPATDGEPRRVRTIPIRPDQGAATAAADTNTAAPPPPEMPAAVVPTPAAPMPAAQPPAAPAPTASRGRGSRAAKPPASVAAAEPPPQAQAQDSEPPAAHAPPAPAPAAASGQPHRMATASNAANAADGTGHYVVQVSSQRSEADAQASYKALQQKYASVLGGHDPIIRRADLGEKGTFYRAQVGPFATMDEATQLCNSLKSAGGQCIIQRN
jgi:cell division septation protein DedD